MMNVEQVQEARRLAWSGVTSAEVARRLGKPPTPVRYAITGKTYRFVTDPPPLPEGALRDNKGKYLKTYTRQHTLGRKPCRRCELLTDHASGYCQFCHSEGRAL
jgi:RNA polymerase subunit RPABC4/transcription elongation factor Spt4